MHIIGTYLSFLTGISPLIFSKFIQPIFSIFYIFSFYLLYKELLKNKKEIVLAMAFTSILVFGTGNIEFAPFFQSVLTIPFFLYIYFKVKSSNISQFKFLLVVISFLFIFFHPITALVLFIILLILISSEYIKFKTLNPHSNHKSIPYYLIIVFVVGFLIWRPYSFLIKGAIESLYYSLILGKSLNLQNGLGIATQVTPVYFIISIFQMYGQYIFIAIGCLVAIYLLIKDNKRNYQIKFLDFLLPSKYPQVLNIFSYLKSYEIFSSLGFLFFFSCTFIAFFAISIFGYMRFFAYALIFANFLIFGLIYFILKSNINILKSKYAKIAVLTLLIFPIITFSTFNLYYSPIIKAPNEQVTQSEIVGMDTFLVKKDKMDALNYGINQFRFENLILGEEANEYGLDKHLLDYYHLKPINHFGYDNQTSIPQYYNKSVYLLVNDVGRDFFPYVYPNSKNRWTFTPDDFEKLRNDHGIQFIYDNGNLEVYKSN